MVLSLLGADSHHWRVIRTLLLVVALTAMLGLYLARTVAQIDSGVGVILTNLRDKDMGTASFSTTINGVTYSRTYVQLEGESDAEFEARALRSWQAYIERIGG